MPEPQPKRTSEDCQFTRGNNPSRLGVDGVPLPPPARAIASSKDFSPIGVRFYDGDHQRLLSMGKERSDFIRDAVRAAFEAMDPPVAYIDTLKDEVRAFSCY